MKKLSFVIFIFYFFSNCQAQKNECIEKNIEKVLIEDSLLLNIDNFQETLNKLGGKWKFVKLTDHNNESIEYLTEKFEMSKDKFEWIASSYSFDHTLTFEKDNLTKEMTFSEDSNAFQVEKYKLIYLPNIKRIKLISLQGDEVCTQIPSIYKINLINDNKLIIFHLPFENKEGIKYIQYVYEKK